MTPEQHEQLLQKQFNDLSFYGQSAKEITVNDDGNIEMKHIPLKDFRNDTK